MIPVWLTHDTCVANACYPVKKTLDFSGPNTKYGKAIKSVSFLETYSLQRGLKHFGKAGRNAAMGEMRQLHEREVFEPMNRNELKPSERKKILESLIFLVQKRDGKVKARAISALSSFVSSNVFLHAST